MKNILKEVRADFKTFGAFEKLVFILLITGVASIVLCAITLLVGLLTGATTGNNIPLI